MSPPPNPLAVSVVRVETLGRPLVAVHLRLADGTEARMVMDSEVAALGHVIVAASAVSALFALKRLPSGPKHSTTEG